jgi:hypothetical protein
MMVPIRYRLYFWNPPILTSEQELEFGRQIVTQGRAAFFEQYHPYLSDKEQQQIQHSKQMMPKQKTRAIILAVLFFGPLLFFVGAPLLVFVLLASPILALSLGTMLVARKRYRRWVDEMADKYARHVASLPPRP